jgi:tetratricopeptide (TPR) repeat protein
MNTSDLSLIAINEYKKGNFNQALVMYKKAMEKAIYTDLGASHYNIGLCHFSLFNYIESEASFKRAFIEYGYLHCGYELSMSLLFNDKLKEGLNLYQYRYYGVRKSFPDLPIPNVLTVEQCRGKKVLVLNEQGLGDEIMFSRGITELSRVASSVMYQVYDKMLTLFEYKMNHFDNVTYFTNRSFSLEFVMSFDCWITSGDLFSTHLLNHGMDHQEFQVNSSTQNQTLDIGITWCANALSASSKLRSLDITELKEALVGDNTNIISLQLGECMDWMTQEDISDFRKTFDVISKLDIVVTVDTVTAHLAGMMGKPTILVHSTYLDWRWVYKMYNNVTIVHISELKVHMDKIRQEFY